MVPARMSPATPLPAEAAGAAGLLDVGDGHAIHWRQLGAPGGIPALVLHGGPGSGHSPALARLLDSSRFCVTGFDQRGCGRSRPRPGLAHNTTWHLVRDIEALREHLGIARWLVVGGSWGATLALAYASRHPEAVAGLLLRGLWVPSPAEVGWFFRGARVVAPQAWQALAAPAPQERRDALAGWLAEVFAGGDDALQARVARAWSGWEQALEGLPPRPPADDAAQQALLDRYRVQSHYLAHGCWLGLDAGTQHWLRPGALAAVPVQFLHGEQDRVCRPEAAQAVHRLLPGSVFTPVADAGHGPFHPAMARALSRALEGFATHGTFLPQALPA